MPGAGHRLGGYTVRQAFADMPKEKAAKYEAPLSR
jgi:hypothetical protein